MRSTFKILMYLKKGSEKPNGNVPLMCRLTVDGEIKQFSCKMDVPPRLWDVKAGRASGKSIEAQTGARPLFIFSFYRLGVF